MSAAVGGTRSRLLVLLAVLGLAVLGLVVLARGGAWAQSAGITVDPSALGELTEAAGAARSGAFTVVLDAAPGGDVTVTLAHGGDVSVDADPGAGGNQDTLVFTAANWDTARTVAVVAVDDTVDEAASEGFSIDLSAAGGGYDGVTARVVGSVADDDTAVFSVSVDKSTIAEAGAGTDAGTATLTVDITNGVSYAADRDIGLVLSGSARVGEDFKLADGDGWTLPRPFVLRFAPGAAQTAAVVTVVDDARDDDAETVSIAVHADGAAIGTVTLAIADDDDPPLVLSALAVTTAADLEMYPAFEAGAFHYAVGCETDDPLTTGAVAVALSAQAADTRVSVNGVQAANQNGEVELDGLDGYSDVDIVLSDSSGASTAYTVHCLPKAFPLIVTTKQPGAWDGLVTISARVSGKRGQVWSGYIAIIDNNGVPRFHRKVATGSTGSTRVSQFRTHKNGRYPYSYARQHGALGNDENWEQVVLDADLTQVARVRTSSALQHTGNHDFVIRENGNYILMAYEPTTHDLSGYFDEDDNALGSDAHIIDSVIEEVTPTGERVHVWNSLGNLKLVDCNRHARYFTAEWAHVNSLQEVGGEWIASFRSCSQVLRINPTSGDVVWLLGKSRISDEDWTAAGGEPPLAIVGDPYGEFCGQHSARLLANGHLLLFDNGGFTCNGRRQPKRFSRVVEYALDLEKRQATFVRHHSLGRSFNSYSYAQGVVELMDNGHWLISWGRGPGIAVTEVVPGARGSQAQGRRLLSIKLTNHGSSIATRAYPVSPGALAEAPAPPTAEIARSTHNSEYHHGASDTVRVVVAFSRPVVDFDRATPSVRVTGARVESVAPHVVAGEAAHAYVFELVPDGDGPVGFSLVAYQSCDGGGICTKDGALLTEATAVHVIPRSRRAAWVISGLADASVAENTVYGPVTPSVTPAPAGSATWSLEGDDADVFTIDTGTGALSMTAKDFEAPADADGDNVYEVTVRAVAAAGRTGVLSVGVTVTDAVEAPGRPSAPVVTEVSPSRLSVRWSAPANTGPAITDYDYRYKKTSASAWTEVIGGQASTALAAVIGSLDGATSYDVAVRAANAEGTGEWSATTAATTPSAAIAPEAVDDLSAAAQSDSVIELTWTKPDVVGPAISGYELQRKTGADSYSVVSSDIAAGATSYRDGDLSAATTYTYRIRAVNSVGSGAWSNESAATTAAAAVVNGAPVFSGVSASATAAENQTAVAGSPTAADPDAGDTVTYGIDASSGDGASFDINAGSGVLSFKAAPDYEAKSSYAVTVRARDSRDADGNPDTAWDASIAVTVTVTDVNEPPPQPTPSATAPQRGAEPEPATGGAADDRTEFTDIGGSAHRDNIESIAQAKITLGCNPPANDRFCPRRAVTRAQMARFLARALRLPAAARDRFTDTTGSVHRDSINRIARAKITLGCNPPANDRFCPQRAVTRAQMASFLARALRLPAARDYFTDTTGSVHRDSINRIARAKITLGCNPPANDRFCPRRAVTRAQMASFLARALTLPDSAP